VQDGVSGQRHASAAIPPGIARYPLSTAQVAGGPHGRSERVRRISKSHPAGFEPRIFQPVARRYTDNATADG
jgi:hypothetical protein